MILSKQDYLDHIGIDRWQPNICPDDPWTTLQTSVSTCKACSLHHGRTQTVFGRGSQKARLMIIGEAPGFHEDKQGKPFVGRAGKLLDAMLQAIGLDSESVYIANILKCRPPENRDPAPDEVAKCTPFLMQQIALLQPTLLLATGRISAQFLLNTNAPLSRLRQSLHTYGETKIPLIVTYHPAYLLRNSKDKAKAFVDLQQVARILASNQ